MEEVIPEQHVDELMQVNASMSCWSHELAACIIKAMPDANTLCHTSQAWFQQFMLYNSQLGPLVQPSSTSA